MIRGIYSAASGMGVQQAKMDTISNNLANISVNGFKKDIVTQQSFADLLLMQQDRNEEGILPSSREYVGRTGQGAAVTGVVTDFSAGLIKQTGKPTDLSLQKENCFFILMDPQNPDRTYYTRDGAFYIDQDGYLANPQGHRLLGDNGPIRVGDDKFHVSTDGKIIVSGQAQPIKLSIAQFDNPGELKKLGENYFTAVGGAPLTTEDAGVIQGSLEKSNVDPASEMANMISVMKNYEANQKIIHAHDQLLDLAVNRVGSLK